MRLARAGDAGCDHTKAIGHLAGGWRHSEEDAAVAREPDPMKEI